MSSSSAVFVFFVVGMFKWWYDLSDATKSAVIGGPLLVICILVIYCCCCRSRPANQGAVLVTPAAGPTAVMATSTNTTAPMQPLVNVAWVNTADKCARHAQFLINFEVFAEELRLRVYAVRCKHSQYLQILSLGKQKLILSTSCWICVWAHVACASVMSVNQP